MSDSGAEAALRRDARAILDAALAAVEPAGLVERALRARPLRPAEGGGVVLLAIGKAARGMCEGALRVLGGDVREAHVLLPHGFPAPSEDAVTVHRGGHPLPDEAGIAAARALADAVRRAGPADRVLVLLSGGGSALLTDPVPEVTLADLRAVTDLLLRAGASIDALNTVRKHVESLKGGGLARLAMPAPVRALVLSDVIGDPLDVIASGPVSPDPTTYADAIAVLEDRGILEATPEAIRRRLSLGREGIVPDTPKPGDPVFAAVSAEIVGSSAHAARGAAERAASLGYSARVISTALRGEAREVGGELARLARTLRAERGVRRALVATGETTVCVRGAGLGGRNQEVALGAAVGLAGMERVLVMSCGTDGIDGPTDAAGALATGASLDRARRLGLDPDAHLARNDAYRFFASLGDLIVTGPTGTNVMDLFLVLIGD